MDELVDILDADGQPTGKTAMKSIAHSQGLYHPTIHVWFYTTSGQILLQQRGRHKDTHPLLWDVSVAGHIGAGEGVVPSAIREVKEEIGLDIGPGELQKIGIYLSVHEHENLIDKEYHHSFICELSVPLSHLVKQESEVEELKLMALTQFAEETWGLAHIKKYVPYERDYLQRVITSIQKNL